MDYKLGDTVKDGEAVIVFPSVENVVGRNLIFLPGDTIDDIEEDDGIFLEIKIGIETDSEINCVLSVLADLERSLSVKNGCFGGSSFKDILASFFQAGREYENVAMLKKALLSLVGRSYGINDRVSHEPWLMVENTLFPKAKEKGITLKEINKCKTLEDFWALLKE